MNNNENEKKPLDELLREAKERFLLEGQKAFMAINSAGAVALMTLLQSDLGAPNAASMRPWVLYGIVAFVIGVAVAAASYPIRHYALNRRALTAEDWVFKVAYWYVPSVSILAFLTGSFLPVIGAFLAICSKAP